MNKMLNLKNMKETLVNYSSGSQEEMDRIWKALYTMYQCGFISHSTWKDFFMQCKDWHIEYNCVRNADEDIIWDYDKGTYYI